MSWDEQLGGFSWCSERGRILRLVGKNRRAGVNTMGLEFYIQQIQICRHHSKLASQVSVGEWRPPEKKEIKQAAWILTHDAQNSGIGKRLSLGKNSNSLSVGEIQPQSYPEATWNHAKRVFKERHRTRRALASHPGLDPQDHKETKNLQKTWNGKCEVLGVASRVALWLLEPLSRCQWSTWDHCSPYLSWALAARTQVITSMVQLVSRGALMEKAWQAILLGL